MKPVAYAMCGIAFSGKSTAARRVAQGLGIELIVLDRINEERGLDGTKGLTDKQWEETSLIAMDRLRGHLRAGSSVVIDDTFSHRFLRDRCRKVADEADARFAILFVDTPLEVIDARRAENLRNPTRPHLDDAVFAHHRDRFQFPTVDEPAICFAGEHDFAQWLEGEKQRRSATSEG